MDLLPHLKEGKFQAEFSLNFDGQIAPYEETAI